MTRIRPHGLVYHGDRAVYGPGAVLISSNRRCLPSAIIPSPVVWRFHLLFDYLRHNSSKYASYEGSPFLHRPVYELCPVIPGMIISIAASIRMVRVSAVMKVNDSIVRDIANWQTVVLSLREGIHI